jgi:nucleoside-diphosphate-sugar epimerase
MQHPPKPDLKGHKVLVTGANGFVGRAVMQALETAGAVPVGLVRSGDPAEGRVVADLLAGPLDPLLADTPPDSIIHCAGLTAAPDTDAGRDALFAANLTATARLIAAVSRMPRPARVVVVSSAAIWASMPDGLAAIDETHPMRPVGAYGVSKAAATLHALAEADRLGLDLAVAVPFNIMGPGQRPQMVPQVFIDALRASPPQFTVPNPTVVRDWIDLRDVADALVRLAIPDGPCGMFNVASGTGRTLTEMAGAICAAGGWRTEILPAKTASSPGVLRSIGNPARLMQATGWAPRHSLSDSLHAMILASAPGL